MAGSISGATVDDPAVCLDVVDIERSYGRVMALAGVSLTVGTGEIVCLVGPSGCGKSTLLRIIAGVERATAGSVEIGGRAVASPDCFVVPERRGIGFVVQDHALFPHLTVQQNVLFGLRHKDRSEARAIARTALQRVGLSGHADHYPHMLSGGEQQRVALARALVPEPLVLLMDEPFSSLDPTLRRQVRLDTMSLLRRQGTTAVIVTHDPEEAMTLADRLVLMQAGRVIQTGTPAAIHDRPASRFAAGFFGALNELPGVCQGGRVATPLGSFPAPPACPDGQAVILCIRPQNLRRSSNGMTEGGSATVRGRRFGGEIEELELAVDGLAFPLAMRGFGRSELAIGDRIAITVAPDSVMVFAVGA